MKKPVLLGLNNPHSTDPERALGVEPKGTSGYRLWSMLATEALIEEPPTVILAPQYEAGFDRYNISDELVFRPVSTDRYQFIRDKIRGRTVVMCGTNVPRYLDLQYTGFHLKPMIASEFIYYVIPHPSGLCREYNNPQMRAEVGQLLLMLYKEGLRA